MPLPTVGRGPSGGSVWAGMGWELPSNASNETGNYFLQEIGGVGNPV